MPSQEDVCLSVTTTTGNTWLVQEGDQRKKGRRKGTTIAFQSTNPVDAEMSIAFK